MLAAISFGKYRRGLTVALLLLMMGLGLAMVFHLLSEVHGHDLRGAIRALTPGAIAGALALTILSYLSLTLYDHMAAHHRQTDRLAHGRARIILQLHAQP